MAYTATELRRDIYKVLDRVLETGETVEVERNGRLLRISAVTTKPRVERIRVVEDLIAGDPGAMEHIDWSREWKP